MADWGVDCPPLDGAEVADELGAAAKAGGAAKNGSYPPAAGEGREGGERLLCRTVDNILRGMQRPVSFIPR